MINKKTFGLLLLAVLLVGFVPAVSANSNLEVQYLKIDGEELDPYNATSYTLEVNRGDVLPIRVAVANADNNTIEDVQLTAGIFGYQYSQYETQDVIQTTKTFDLAPLNQRTLDTELTVPVNMENGQYKLRLFVTDKNSNAYVQEYNLNVVGVESENAVVIKEAYLSPSNEVQAGRALSALVKVENVGQDDLDDITLSVDVPALNIRDTETLDELQAGEKETFEKIIMRFPKNAQAGVYDIVYTVSFDEYESTTHTATVSVLGEQEEESEEPEQKTFVTVPNSQLVTKGAAGAVYPIMISNAADSAQTYTISVQGVDEWGTVRVDPSSQVVVPAQGSSTAYMYVSANEAAQAGDKYFKLSISDGEETKEISLTAAVSEPEDAQSWDGLKKALEIGLIVLVIILILVGLIVGFNKIRGSDDDEEDDEKTYY